MDTTIHKAHKKMNDLASETETLRRYEMVQPDNSIVINTAKKEGLLKGKREINRHRKALEYALKKICSSRLSKYVDSLYLYGSYARSTYRWDSDIDMLLVLDEESNNLKREIKLLKTDVTMEDIFAVDIDLKIVFGDKWEYSYMLFYQTIKEEGIKIW